MEHPAWQVMAHPAHDISPTYSYQRERSVDAGAFSHAGGGAAAFTGQIRWVTVDPKDLPRDVYAYLISIGRAASANSSQSVSYANKYYGVSVDQWGKILLYKWALADAIYGLGATGLGPCQGSHSPPWTPGPHLKPQLSGPHEDSQHSPPWTPGHHSRLAAPHESQHSPPWTPGYHMAKRGLGPCPTCGGSRTGLGPGGACVKCNYSPVEGPHEESQHSPPWTPGRHMTMALHGPHQESQHTPPWTPGRHTRHPEDYGHGHYLKQSRYVKFGLSGSSLGAATPITSGAEQVELDTAKRLMSYISTNGCDNSPAFGIAVTAFQISRNTLMALFNAASGANGPMLPVNGIYGPDTVAAVKDVAATHPEVTFVDCSAAPNPPAPAPTPAPVTTLATAQSRAVTGAAIAGVTGLAIGGLAAYAYINRRKLL